MRGSLLLLLVLGAIPSTAQTLVCPPGAAAPGRTCNVFHFHVRMYDPEEKAFVTVHGTNRFASMASCESAREARDKQNAALIEAVRKVKPRAFEPDQTGPCHCDLSIESGSPAFLTGAQREAQLRGAEEVRRHVRDRLADLELPVESLMTVPVAQTPVRAILGGPRLVSVPAPAARPVERSQDDLQMPRPAPATDSAAALADLPLAEVLGGVPAPPPPLDHEPAAAAGRRPPAKAARPAAEPEVEEERVSAPPAPAVAPPEAPGDEAVEPGVDPADRFIRLETERMKNVVDAIPDPPDETSDRVLEACTQRLQALTNLRSLIVAAGAGSAVARAASDAKSNAARLDLVTRLFGDAVAAHWIPEVTTDVLLPADPALDENPEKVLRNAAGTYSAAQRRRALYRFLSLAPIHQEDRAWLVATVEELMQ